MFKYVVKSKIKKMKKFLHRLYRNFVVKYLLLLTFLTLIGFFFEKYTTLDFIISDKFWNKETGWTVKEGDFWFYFFYKYSKKVFITFLIALGSLAFFSFFRKNFKLRFEFIKAIRYRILFSIFLIVSYIIIISTVRSNSQVPCPKYYSRYNGYLQMDEPIKINCKECKCFPGAHSTIGFSIIFFSFCASREAIRKAIVTIGIVLGYIFGFYQVLRGEHYFFDNYFSMLIALWLLYVIFTLKFLIKRRILSI